MNHAKIRTSLISLTLLLTLFLFGCGESRRSKPSIATGDPQVFADSKCGTLEHFSWHQTKCYWDLAVSTRDFKICNNLPNNSQEVIIGLPEDDPDYKYAQSVKEYTYINNCKDSIHYLRDEAEWNLMEGIPPFADPQALIYSGSATLKGWGKYEPEFEGNDPILLFYLTEESIQSMPPAFQKFKAYKLKEIITEESPVWDQYSEEKPITITAKELELQIEGAPTLNFVEIP